VNEIKDVNPLVGSTAEVQVGKPSSPVMKDGEEPEYMLLALLNNALFSMVEKNQARIIGTGTFDGLVGTLVIVYGVVPTANNLLATQPTTEEPTTANSQQVKSQQLPTSEEPTTANKPVGTRGDEK
jgi:hypothetical protein